MAELSTARKRHRAEVGDLRQLRHRRRDGGGVEAPLVAAVVEDVEAVLAERRQRAARADEGDLPHADP